LSEICCIRRLQIPVIPAITPQVNGFGPIAAWQSGIPAVYSAVYGGIQMIHPSLPATNAKRLCKGAKRRSNPFFLEVESWIASLRSQ
jgi:hypothetical protein